MLFITYANADFFYGLLIIPGLLILFVISLFLKNKALKKYGELHIINSLMPEVSSSRPIFKFLIILIALSMLIIALTGPRYGSKTKEVKRESAEIIIALDVSNSMLATDMYPNRLENAKAAIKKMIKRLYNDKIGLIIFAGEAYIQVPITKDYMATSLFVESVTPSMISTQGTAIDKAIKLAINAFSPETEKGKVLIIITDGENHEEDPLPIVKEAVNKGIVVHTIGLGSSRGVPIPLKENSSEFRKDREGNIIVTKLDEKTLSEIASLGKGLYVKATNANSGLNMLYDEINKMEKGEQTAYVDLEDKFMFFVVIAFILILADVFIMERKNRWLRKISIFK